tara:strand:- start:4 stop:312 length:309 start_codon:yes stop_codon:yes gene_type:complete
MSQVQNTPKTKPLSNKAFRLALEVAGTPKEEIDVLVANAVERGAITKSSSGKLNVLRDAFPTFAEIENQLNGWFESNKDEIDSVLTSNGFDKAKKISVNVNK